MERYYKKYSKFLVFPAVFLFICVVAIPFAIGLVMASRLYKGINPCSWISAKFIAFNVSNNSSQVYL